MTLPRPTQATRTCVAGALAPNLAPHACALFHSALVHAGPAIAFLQVLIVALIKAFLWGWHSESLLPAWGSALLPCSPVVLRPHSPVPQSLPVKATGQVQWYDSGPWVLEHKPPLRQGPEAQGSRVAGDTQEGGVRLRAQAVFVPQPHTVTPPACRGPTVLPSSLLP